MRHFVSIKDLNDYDLQKILELIPRARKHFQHQRPAQGHILANLFFEPSTRTRLSFESAMKRLGGETIGFSDGSNTSVSKGESRMDTAMTVSNYSDIIVVRDSIPFTPLEMSKVAGVPIINAGDGTNEHPTQTLTDLVTIHAKFNRLNNLTVGFCGDLLHGRTVHSLVEYLSKWKSNKFIQICPKELRLPEEIVKELESKDIEIEWMEDFKKAIENLDVLYMTRIQRERFVNIEDYERNKGIFILTPEIMLHAPHNMIVMHPLPRVDEIVTDIDNDRRAWYFKQVKYGLYARMALIYHMLHL